MRVTENELDAFRAEHLTPSAILRLLEQYVRVLLRLAVGVGKSSAAIALLLSELTYQRFDLVVYAAPAWNILAEIITAIERSGFSLPWAVIRPRPAERCGELDEQWRAYEGSRCFALAKVRLCRERCPHRDDCDWPGQFEKLQGTRLVLMTEQRLDLVRTMISMLQARTGGRRTLVVLDEARTLDTNFDVVLPRHEVDRFREAVMCSRSRKIDWPPMRAQWISALDRVLTSTPDAFAVGEFTFPDLGKFAFAVQAWGWGRYRQAFRYLGHDLALLNVCRDGERWIDEDGYHFIARPYLHAHLLLLSAHVTADYAGHRLGQGPIASPFDDYKFVHTGTRVFNVRNSCGADRHFASNRERILDTFAVAILCNVLDGRTTLLVSKKHSKRTCADYLARRLAGWGASVRFVLDGESPPAVPDPRVVPIIHYGVLGVNDYTEYETCYCLNSFYIRSDELNRAVQEFEPKHFRAELEIVRTPDRCREVRVRKTDTSDDERAWLGDVYLRKLEVDPVIQAGGRVRFLTKPREVVFFQMNDLARDLGEVRELGCLADLRAALGVPSARELDDAVEGRRAAELMASGMSANDVATQMGISRATVFRRLEAVESLKKHKRVSLREFETLTPFSGSPEGVPWNS